MMGMVDMLSQVSLDLNLRSENRKVYTYSVWFVREIL